MTGSELVAAIGAALAGVEGVRLAWVFGSRVSGRARVDSDLDIAVRFDAGLEPGGREAARRRLVAALSDELGALGERADVVDLDRADGAVAFEAVRRGDLALARSEAERVDAVARVARRYDDERGKRALFRRAAVAAARRLGEQADGRR